MLLNRAGLLKPEEQRTTAKVFLTAFLEATLNDRADYRKVFVSPAGARDWLPNDVYVTQYQDASFKVVNAHDRMGKLESMELKAAKAETSGLTRPREAGTAAAGRADAEQPGLTGPVGRRLQPDVHAHPAARARAPSSR